LQRGADLADERAKVIISLLIMKFIEDENAGRSARFHKPDNSVAGMIFEIQKPGLTTTTDTGK